MRTSLKTFANTMLKTLLACALVLSGVALAQGASQPASAAQPANQLGQKAIRRLLLSSPLVRPFSAYRAANWLAARPAARTTGVHAFGFQPFVRPLAITDDDWLGGAGNWNSTNWSTGSMPGSNNNAVINNSTPAAVVQFNVSDTINNLTIGSTSVLNINNNNILTIDGTTITNSNNTGTGGLTLSSVGNSTELFIGNSVTLTGGGTVTLSNNGNNWIVGVVGTDVLTNANNTIQGSRTNRRWADGSGKPGDHRCQSVELAHHPDE